MLVMGIMTDLNLNLDADTASNILAGIYEATLNLTSKMTPETYIAVGTAMQKGGNVTPQAPVAEIPVVQAAPQSAPVAASAPVSPVSDGQVVASAPQQGFDLRQVFNLPSDAAVASPGIVSANLADTDPNAPVSSPEERPMGEQVSSPIEAESTPTPDWLVPKIYKGGSTS